MLPDGLVASEEVLPEVTEQGGALAAEHIDVVLQELEGDGLLELHRATWGVGEEEPKVNVEDVASALVDEDVAVVPVLHLKNIGDEGVRRQ